MQDALVPVIVMVAAAYAAWALMPASLRRSLALRTARTIGGEDQPGLRGRIAKRLLRVANAPARGCSDCPANVATPAERAGEADRG